MPNIDTLLFRRTILPSGAYGLSGRELSSFDRRQQQSQQTTAAAAAAALLGAISIRRPPAFVSITPHTDDVRSGCRRWQENGSCSSEGEGEGEAAEAGKIR